MLDRVFGFISIHVADAQTYTHESAEKDAAE